MAGYCLQDVAKITGHKNVRYNFNKTLILKEYICLNSIVIDLGYKFYTSLVLHLGDKKYG